MSVLGDKQRRFSRYVAKLLQFLWSAGYEVAFGEALRSDEQAEINSLGYDGREKLSKLVEAEYPELAAKIRNNGKANGIKASIHQDKLAIDLLVFKNGKYLTETEDYKEAGLFWEGLATECMWGGRFRDGNHFSIGHNGKR